MEQSMVPLPDFCLSTVRFEKVDSDKTTRHKGFDGLLHWSVIPDEAKNCLNITSFISCLKNI